MDLLEKGWFIIFLVIAFIGGNLAALRVTANMKFPRGIRPTSKDSSAPLETHTANADNANSHSNTIPNTPHSALSDPPQHSEITALQPLPSRESNVTVTQQEQPVRKQDHNHHNQSA